MSAAEELLTCDPKVMGAEVVFRNTRVPLRALLDYFAGGDSLDEFLTDFPGISRDVAMRVIEALGSRLNQEVHAAAS